MNQKHNDEGGPENNVGALWNKIGKKEDFMLMKITVDKPGNHTFVVFRNRDKDTSTDDGYYDKQPMHFIFPYRPKNKNKENYNE